MGADDPRRAPAMRNFWLDALILLLLGCTFVTGERRCALHPYLSILFGVGSLLHLARHLPTLGALPRRFVARVSARRRAVDLLSLLLLVLLGLTLGGGIFISTWVTDAPAHAWVRIHHVTPKLLLLGVIAHLLLHWGWIVATARALARNGGRRPAGERERGQLMSKSSTGKSQQSSTRSN
jgi:hypothetical protein